MTTYTDVFGSETIPPSQNRYVAVALTADTTFYWPEQATGSNLMADIMEVTPTAAYTMTFPDATLVGTGRDTLVRNLGAYTITLKDNSGGTIGTVAAGVAKYAYLTSNSTVAGVWTIFTFGTGTSAADASTLAGYGLTATGSTLSQSTSTVSSSISATLAATDRSSLRIFSASGAVTCSLPTAVGLGNGWFACISNQGTGVVTIDPNSTETIDGEVTKDLAPGESTYIVTDGANWITVGYGRSAQFQFTKLVYPIAVGTPFTLTSAQAGNKLLEFTGILAEAATVNVPAVVAIYYVECSYTGAYTLTIKTAAGTGVNLNAGDRSILYCDGTNVTSAQTASVAVSNISGGVAGAVPYQTAVGLTGFSAAGTSGHILVSGGTGAPAFGAAAIAPAGLTVSGAAFSSRGITDSATATALTLFGSGANSVTIANSATNPTIGVSGGSLALSSVINYIGTSSTDYGALYGGTGAFTVQATGGSANTALQLIAKGTGAITFGNLAETQVAVINTASTDRYITLTGSNGGNPTIGTSAGSLALSVAVVAASTVTVGSNLFANGYAQVNSDDATPAGGATNTGLFLGVSAIGIYFGSGAPTVSAAQGSLYIRTDGGASTRLYSNNNGTTGWSAITSA